MWIERDLMPPSIDSGPPAALLEAARAAPSTPPEDRLQRLRALVIEARDLEADIADLDARLREAKASLNTLYHKTLPDLFDEAQVNSVSIPAEGNHPAVVATLKPFYQANIAASWEAEKRMEGLEYLESVDAGDLIKTTVVVPFNREQHGEAKALSTQLQNQGYGTQVQEGVHAQTLTAWLREQVEKRGVIPELDKIGGIVGRVVKLKEIS